MSQIRVTLEDHTGNTSHEVRIPEEASAEMLLPEIITIMKLPITDSSGRQITYHLSLNGQRLLETQALKEAGAEVGDTLTIVPEMVAGTQFGQDMRSSSLVVVVSTPQERQPVAGFPIGWHKDMRTGTIQIQYMLGTMQQVWNHARAHPGQEVGGILLGSVYEEDERFLVKIEKVLEAQHTLSEPASLTFTAQTWLDLLAQRRDHPGLLVVGWYHSHPGLGIFLSRRDEFIQRSFFGNRPWYLALVVDPSSDDWGMFVLEKGIIVRCPDVYTDGL